MSGPPVTIVESGGYPVVAVESGAPVFKVVETGGYPVTVVESGATPLILDGYTPPA